jgi:hypothetical protein
MVSVCGATFDWFEYEDAEVKNQTVELDNLR